MTLERRKSWWGTVHCPEGSRGRGGILSRGGGGGFAMEFPQFSSWDRKVWHRCRQVAGTMIEAGGILFLLCQKCSHLPNCQPPLTALGFSSSSSSSSSPVHSLSPLPSSALCSALFSSTLCTFYSGHLTHIHSFEYHLYGRDPQIWSSLLNSLLWSNPDISYVKLTFPNKCHGISHPPSVFLLPSVPHCHTQKCISLWLPFFWNWAHQV